MNIAQLRAFVTIVDCGSFSEAARELGLSQPAVTMQIQGLESDTGVTLLDRRYRRVDLTEAGRSLLPHARKVLDQLETARLEIERLSDTVSGRLAIGASTTPGVYLVPFLLGKFLDAYPEVGVSVMLSDSARVIEAVESGEVNFGVSGATAKNPRVTFEELGSDELIVICAPSNPLASRKPVPFADLREERWVQREAGSGTRKAAEVTVIEHGLDPSELCVAVELSTGEAVVSAVEGGLGVAIVSRYVADKAIKLGTVAAVDVQGFPVRRPLYAVMPKTTCTRAAMAFHRHLLDEIAGG